MGYSSRSLLGLCIIAACWALDPLLLSPDENNAWRRAQFAWSTADDGKLTAKIRADTLDHAGVRQWDESQSSQHAHPLSSSRILFLVEDMETSNFAAMHENMIAAARAGAIVSAMHLHPELLTAAETSTLHSRFHDRNALYNVSVQLINFATGLWTLPPDFVRTSYFLYRYLLKDGGVLSDVWPDGTVNYDAKDVGYDVIVGTERVGALWLPMLVQQQGWGLPNVRFIVSGRRTHARRP
jgi:hypothetical protein